MTGAALAYLPIQASPRPAQPRPQPRHTRLNPFSRYPSVQPKPRQGVKNWTAQNATGPTLKTHANPPGIALVAAEAAVGCSVAAETAVPGQLARGTADEAAWLAETGLAKNTRVWRPTTTEIDSATFRAIVGDAKYTAGGKPVGTIFDVTKGGFMEYKSGSSMLDSSYQLRLQTYRSVTTETPFSIVTTRPVNPRFQQSLDFWGVNVVPK
ncbi:MAG: hypothetical protein K2W91_08750 [Novosphingobium sp.]|nr:hypothetical protein [Novosphingobium sp.]